MPKPTPGPWRLVRNWCGRLAIVGPNNDGKGTIGDRICNLPHRRNREGLANAHLVSAAPELLDIALEYRDLCRKHGLDGTEEAINAVIRKAMREEEPDAR